MNSKFNSKRNSITSCSTVSSRASFTSDSCVSQDAKVMFKQHDEIYYFQQHEEQDEYHTIIDSLDRLEHNSQDQSCSTMNGKTMALKDILSVLATRDIPSSAVPSPTKRKSRKCSQRTVYNRNKNETKKDHFSNKEQSSHATESKKRDDKRSIWGMIERVARASTTVNGMNLNSTMNLVEKK